jgi:chemotaxis protein MotB
MRRHYSLAARPSVDHGDDWLITYADMITLLLCFFAIFLSVTIPKKATERSPAVAQSIPLPAPSTSPPATSLPAPVPPATALRTARPIAEMVAVRAEAPAPAMARKPEPSASAPIEVKPQTITAEITPPAILDIAEKPRPGMTEQRGDRITTLEMSSALFFDSGSASLSKAGQTILLEIATKLHSDRFRDYQITVEGHTDDAPIKSARFPSNWELSTARASAVVHLFLDQGIPARRLRAAGYADTFPKAPNRDASGNPIAENQAQNRRVVIKLEKIESASPDTASVTLVP